LNIDVEISPIVWKVDGPQHRLTAEIDVPEATWFIEPQYQTIITNTPIK